MCDQLKFEESLYVLTLDDCFNPFNNTDSFISKIVKIVLSEI